MIHEFKILCEHSVTGEEGDSPGALDMSLVKFYYQSLDDLDCTTICLTDGDKLTVRMHHKDFLDIWRAHTDTINLNM